MPFNFYLTSISSKDTKKANPESALGIQLMMLVYDRTKHQVLQPHADFYGTWGCSVFQIIKSLRHDPKINKFTSPLHPKGHNGYYH